MANNAIKVIESNTRISDIQFKHINSLLIKKLVTAIIKPFKVEEVRASLDEIGVSGMTMTKVKGQRQKGQHRII